MHYNNHYKERSSRKNMEMQESSNRVRIRCECGRDISVWDCPKLTTDSVIRWYNPSKRKSGIIMLYKKVKVLQNGLERLGYKWEGPETLEGYALPGGFVEWAGDHTIQDSAEREAKEETGLVIKCESEIGIFDKELRDYGRRNISVAFNARGDGEKLKEIGKEEEKEGVSDIEHFSTEEIREIWEKILFDHTLIITKSDLSNRYFPPPFIFEEKFYKKM